MNCPIAHCPCSVDGPLRICREHYKKVPVPQQEALNHYARTRKGGPAHRAAFARAVESVESAIASFAARTPKKQAAMPYRDD